MDTNIFKQRLEDELKTVESELKTVGAQNPKNPADWEGKEVEMDVSIKDELPDKLEEYTTNRSITDTLEVRFNEIRGALERISAGEYGTCEVGGEPIEEDRLDADPAARTCKKHVDTKLPPL